MNLKDFDKLLAKHDWFYDYSDDYSVWQKGVNESRFIAIVAKSSDKHKALYDVWADYIYISKDKAKLTEKREELL